jgi:hypothetical protein
MQLMTTVPVLLAQDKPAGGAAAGEVIAASAIGLGLTAALLGLVYLHRTGRTTVLTRAGTRLGKATGAPPWVALPTIVATTSLLVALFGMMWDISFHIDKGRDPGPLANPAHYFILFGLFGVFAGGVLACAMPMNEKPGPVSVRFLRDWYVPVGGLLLTGCGFYALAGFPLDDIWHRLFGQDVTLWGPTHLMLIGGAGLSLVGILLLEHEGHTANRAVEADDAAGGTVLHRLRRGAALGGLLLGLSVYQGEFDFNVPQFRLVLDPLMIAAAAGIALVAARLLMGRGGAIGTAVFFLVVRGIVSLLVGPVLGHTTPVFPLYLGCALLVELLALAGPLLRRPILFGATSGVLIGTLGFLTEAWWSNLVRILKWGSDIAVEGTLMALAGGIAGGVLGALLALGLRRQLPRPAVARGLVVGCLVLLAAALTNGLIVSVPRDVTATFAVQDVQSSPRMGTIRVQLHPADAVDDPSWVVMNSWQGGGLVVDNLHEIGAGTYQTTEPIPLDGSWKTMLRLHDGRILAAAPVFLPEDGALNAAEIPAVDGMTRPIGSEKLIFQREQKTDVPGWLWPACALVVLLCTLAIIAAISWGVARYSRRGSSAPAAVGEPVTQPAPVPSGTR